MRPQDFRFGFNVNRKGIFLLLVLLRSSLYHICLWFYLEMSQKAIDKQATYQHLYHIYLWTSVRDIFPDTSWNDSTRICTWRICLFGAPNNFRLQLDKDAGLCNVSEL